MIWVLSNEVEETPVQQYLLCSLYSFGYFAIIVSIDKLHNCAEGIHFSVKQGKRKKDIVTFHGYGCKEGKK